MDLSFARFDALARKHEVLLDYSSLVASLAALQGTSATALADAALSDGPAAPGHLPALITLLGARTGWTAAIATLRGSFHPAVAERLAARGTKGS